MNLKFAELLFLMFYIKFRKKYYFKLKSYF